VTTSGPPDEEEPSPNAGTVAAVVSTFGPQHRALNAAEAVVSDHAVGHLLETTGPLEELKNAEKRGLLTEARLAMISGKGAGVTFEALTLTKAQHAGERFGIVGLKAALSSKANDPSVDVMMSWTDDGKALLLKVQLKTGSDSYLKAAISGREDGVLLFVPIDAPTDGLTAGVASSIDIGGVAITAPTRDELKARSRRNLERLTGRSSPVVDWKTIGRQAFRDALVDGLVAGVADVCLQCLTEPEKPVDWRQASRALVKTGATGAISSLLAATTSCSAVRLGKHSIDASAAYRAARVGACVVPHAIDVAFDALDMKSGLLKPQEFAKRTSGHTGAMVAELLFFKYVARLARFFGPLGQAVVMIGGGMLVSKLGQAAGEAIYSLVSGLFEGEPPAATASPDDAAESAPSLADFLASLLATPEVASLAHRADREEKRRDHRMAKGACQEPRCGRQHHARGMCSRHYMRWWRLMRRRGWRIQHQHRPHRSPAGRLRRRRLVNRNVRLARSP
jgi:hypothetical protein